MKSVYRIIGLLTILWCSQISAQVPGYLGDRSFAQLGLYGMPNMNGYFAPKFSGVFDRPDNYDAFGWNMGLSGEYGYCIGRQTAFVAGFAMKFREQYFPYLQYDGSFGPNRIIGPLPDDPYLITVNRKVNFSFRFYGGDNLAPTGQFGEMGFSHNKIRLRKGEVLYSASLNDLAGEFYMQNPDTLSNIDYTVNLPTLFIGLGRKIVLKDSFFIEMMFRLNYPLKRDYFGFLRGGEPAFKQEYPSVMNLPSGEELEYPVLGASPEDDDFGETSYYLFWRLRKIQYANELIDGKVSVGFVF